VSRRLLGVFGPGAGWRAIRTVAMLNHLLIQIQIEFGFDLFPRPDGFAGVAFYGDAEIHQIFDIFESFLETTNGRGQ
jgi:hypothetical protein